MQSEFYLSKSVQIRSKWFLFLATNPQILILLCRHVVKAIKLYALFCSKYSANKNCFLIKFYKVIPLMSFDSRLFVIIRALKIAALNFYFFHFS